MKADLEAVIQQLKPFLPRYLEEQGVDPTKKFSCIFPDHEDDSPSCNVFLPDKSRFKCHGCGRSGDIFTAAHLYEGKPRTGKEWVLETVRYLAEKYGVEMPEYNLTPEEAYELDTYRAYRAAMEIIVASDNSSNALYQAELLRRKWVPEFLASQGVGTVASFDDFVSELQYRGFSKDFLEEVDLCRGDIFNPNNVIHAWRDDKGRPVGFTSRNMAYESEKAEAEKLGVKYTGTKCNCQHSSGLKCNIFPKSKLLYGIDSLKPGPVYVFEGQADVLTARQNGLHNCVAVGGCHLSDDQVSLLKRLGHYDVILCLDADKAGQDQLLKTLEETLAGHRDFRVRVVTLPEGEDPDSFIRSNKLGAFKDLAHWTAFEWRLNRYPDDADETTVCQQMLPFIVNEPSPIARDKLCKILSKRTGVGLRAINAELAILSDEKAYQRSLEKREFINEVVSKLRSVPEQAEIILQEAQTNLQDLVKKHDEDTLSAESFVQAIDDQRAEEENVDKVYSNFKFGPDLREIEEAFRGDCEGVWICVGANENVGKCLVEDTPILLSDGTYKKIKDVYRDRDDTIVTMSPNYGLQKAHVSDWIDSGKLPCYKVALSNGLEIEVSESHPFYTPTGWKNVKDLCPGDDVAVANRYQCFDGLRSEISDAEAIVLAVFLAEGGITNKVKFTNTDTEIIDAFKIAAEEMWPGIRIAPETGDEISYVLSDPQECRANRAKDYLRELGLMGLNSHEKFIPDSVFRSSKKRVARFLGMFWACDGWACKREDGYFQVGISLCNYNLVKQLRSLLLRFGINTHINHSTSFYTGSDEQFDRYTLSIQDIESMRLFYNNIRIPLAYKNDALRDYLRGQESKKHKGSYNGALPSAYWKQILVGCESRGISVAEFERLINPFSRTISYHKGNDRFNVCGQGINFSCNIQRDQMVTASYLVEDRGLRSLADGDIGFAKIESIEFVGEKQCYDLTVPGTHNFIANDIVVHNTALLTKIAYSILQNNEDVLVIYHTIDDTRKQLLPRFVTLADGQRNLSINMVRQPNYWGGIAGVSDLENRRAAAYNKIRGLAHSGRLIIKDISDGSTVPFIKNLISYHREKNPGKRIVYILDNFHKLPDYDSKNDERIRFKKLSQTMKTLALNEGICLLSSVEYPKLPQGTKPHNNCLAETKQVSYDANAIIHLYCDLVDNPGSYKVFHRAKDWRGLEVDLPRIECIIGKNKITEDKKTFFLDFFPASSDYAYVSVETVRRDADQSSGGDESILQMCEKCGASMVVKKGKNGDFLACSAYPECKNTRSINSTQPNLPDIIDDTE